MTLSDIQNIPILQTKAVSIANEDTDTHLYLIDYYRQMLSGDYGVGEEDTNANNEELADGYGKLLCRYPKKEKLENDIYIIAMFNKDKLNDLDYTHTMFLYVDEY